VIFVDTSFWYALADPRDPRYDAAVRLFARRQDQRLVTTDRVIEELWTLTVRRRRHRRAVQTVKLVRGSTQLRIQPVTEPLAVEAWAWLERHDEREYSFVDASSFATMRLLGMTEALAFDGDYSAAGFVELRP
jgi:uncharacterized protein